MIKQIIRIIVASLSIIFLLWFLAPLAFGILNIGNILGIIICVAIFFRSGLSSWYHHMKDKLCDKRSSKLLLRVIQISASIILLYCITVSAFMVYAMIPCESDNATAVVLGAQVKPWGPSALLQQRIDAAIDYLALNPDASAVVTGGKGDDEPVSEAECMRENITASGISEDRIYTEEQATNTDENIRYSLKIIEENGLNSDIAIVTDSYHQLRARIIAHKVNREISISPIITKSNFTGIIAYPTYFVREWIAIPVEIIK